MSSSLLSVSAIALERHCSDRTALRWLLRLEAEHSAILVREGKSRKVYIDREELARVVALDQGKATAAFVRKLDTFLERLNEIETRQNALAQEVFELKRAAGGRR